MVQNKLKWLEYKRMCSKKSKCAFWKNCMIEKIYSQKMSLLVITYIVKQDIHNSLERRKYPK